MHAAAEILDIGRIGRGGAGLLGVGPGLLVRRLAGCFVERDDALARLRYVGAGAEVLQICRIGGDVPVFSASAQAFSSASLRACSSAPGCCCCACCVSEGWLQADARAAAAMTATIASFGNAMPRACSGC